MTQISLGPKCRKCRKDEASCARIVGCCRQCTHTFGDDPIAATRQCDNAIIARISSHVAGFAALCLDCGRISGQQRLISVALLQLALLHGRDSWLPTDNTRRAA